MPGATLLRSCTQLPGYETLDESTYVSVFPHINGCLQGLTHRCSPLPTAHQLWPAGATYAPSGSSELPAISSACLLLMFQGAAACLLSQQQLL